MNLFEVFELTPDERARLDAAPFNPGEGGWLLFARGVLEQVLAAYAAGEIDLRGMLSVMRSCSLGCSVEERIKILAVTVEQALRITPKALKQKRPPHPTWVKFSAASLIQMLQEEHPTERTAPNEMNNWTTSILETAIA